MKILRALWWLTFFVTVGIVVASLPAYANRWLTPEASAEFADVSATATRIGVLLSIGAALFSIALGVLLFWKKGNEPMGLFLAFYLLSYGVLMCGPIELAAEYWLDSLTLALALQGILFGVLSIVLLLIFPNGHFAPRWSRYFVPIAALLFGSTLFLPTEEMLRFATLRSQLINGIAYGILFLAAGIQIYRYRKLYSELERQQTKWVVYGFVVMLILAIIVSIPYYYTQNLPPGTPTPWWAPIGGVGWWLALSILPLSFTLAILRARLWEIDIIVRRTVTYAIVTALLLVVYFGSVILLQEIVTDLTGLENNEFVTVLSTLAIAALFAPLRNRIQQVIDRRFYRKKYDAQKVLQKFSETVRDETDIDKLTAELVKVVNETMQPKSVSLWLKRTEWDKRK